MAMEHISKINPGEVANHQLARRESDLALPSSADAVTYLPPSQLFKLDAHNKPLMPVAEAAIGALTRLAALVKAANDPALLNAYADNLEDMHPRALQLAFEYFEKNWTHPGTLPMPGEIREVGYQALGVEYERQRTVEREQEQREFERALEAGELIPVRNLRADFERIDREIAAKQQEKRDARRELLRRQHEHLLLVEFWLQLQTVKREREAA